MEKPANELKLVACVTVTGIPDCKEKIAFNCQPPRSVSPIPFEANR